MKYIGLFDEKEDIVTKEKLDAVASRVSTNEDNIAMAESDIDGLQTTVNTLQTNVTNVQTALASKQDTVVGGASTITEDNLTASRALVSNSSGKVTVSAVTSTELGYLGGVTNNVQTQLNGKLETVHDNDILWGGKNLHGEVSPTDAAMVSVIGGNKFALCKPQGITIEYTNDGGATWVNYDATEKTKIDVISGISNIGLYYGKKTESSQIVTADDMLRITVNAFTCGVYTSLRKILIGFATNGSTNDFVKIESATIGDQETFTVVGTYNVSGNSGWNSIPYSNNFGAYSLNHTSNVGVLRFTFSTRTASSYQGRPYVQNLVLNGITNYVNPSKLSATGHLYSYDYQQNATFPANVTANKFIGDGSNLTNIPYPVTSVNTKTGAVTLSASDVGAQPTITVNGIIKGDGAGNLSAQDTVAAELVDLPTVPTKVSELTNDANYITAAQAPVQSVNNKTGAVSLTASDVSAIPSTLTGTAGQVLTKTADGQEWGDAPVNSRSVLLQSKTAQMPSSSAWSAIASRGNNFVAIAANSNISAVSNDGLTWTQNTALPESVNWSAITYGKYKFVAVASNSNVSAYSSYGDSWTATTLPASKDWTSIVCGDNKFIVVASNSNTCAYSTDAINWTQQTLPATANWSSVTYGNGKFVAVATGTNIYAYSTDGVTWTQGTFPNSGDWTTVIYGGDKFVAVNESLNLAAYSTDGINWKRSYSPTRDGISNLKITYGGSRFVLVGNDSWFAYSNDGIDWGGFNWLSTGDWSVAYGDGKFVAIAKNSTDVAVTSDPWRWYDRVQRLYNFYNSSNHDVTDEVKEALQIDVSINSRLNRVTNINEADNNYGVYMARGEALFSTETTPSVNGCIAWQYG